MFFAFQAIKSLHENIEVFTKFASSFPLLQRAERNWGICFCFLSHALPIASKNLKAMMFIPSQPLYIYFFTYVFLFHYDFPLHRILLIGPSSFSHPSFISIFHWCLFFPLPQSFSSSPETKSSLQSIFWFPLLHSWTIWVEMTLLQAQWTFSFHFDAHLGQDLLVNFLFCKCMPTSTEHCVFTVCNQ